MDGDVSMTFTIEVAGGVPGAVVPISSLGRTGSFRRGVTGRAAPGRPGLASGGVVGNPSEGSTGDPAEGKTES